MPKLVRQLMLVLALAPTAALATPPDTGFKLFNAMLYKDMPGFGIRQAMVYEQSFFKAGKLADGIRPSDAGIAMAVENATVQIKQYGPDKTSPFIALDLELWPLWPFVSQARHKESISLYTDTARRFKQASNKPICLYSVLPQAGINASTRAVTDKALRAEMLAANTETTRQLKAHVSALCPQLYSYYRFPLRDGKDHALAQWKLFATETIKLARKLAPDLPVYPFVWPQYHQGGNAPGFEFVEDRVWRAQLEHLRSLADGIILWGGFDFGPNKQLAWQDDAGWWRVLKDVFPEQTQTGAK